MQSRNLDYAISALNIIYWLVMVAWFMVLITDNHRLDGWGSVGFAGPALVVALGWHLLRSRRKKLQANEVSGAERRTWPRG